MGEPYSIRIFVPDGDPEGAKIVELMNWTGVGIAFPRSRWGGLRTRPEFKQSGAYILIGPAEGTEDERPTVYIGQSDCIRDRIESHDENKVFWDWGYAFVSRGNALNRAHHLVGTRAYCSRKSGRTLSFIQQTTTARANPNGGRGADIQGFLREMLRILPLLGVRVFEKPEPVATPGNVSPPSSTVTPSDVRDTVVVPAQEPGFTETFLGLNCWYAIRIGGGMLDKIKYIAAYQTSPVRAVTHYARVDRIEPYGDDGKYRLNFAEAAIPLQQPIPFADAPSGSMQSTRYTRLASLLSAKKVTDLFAD